jgi:hypothetical protein
MSETEDKRCDWNIRLFPGLWTAVFLVCAMTGNCRACGLDRDYIGEALECRR